LIVSLVSPGSPIDEGAVNHDAEIVAILGELPGNVDSYPLLDIVQNLLICLPIS